jgi:GWxTD domain-containing protein
MSLLESWVRTPLANAVGWALFYSLWQGALVAAALVLVLRFVRSSNARYSTSCLALLTIAGGFAATLIYFLPESGRSFAVVQAPVFPAWRTVREFARAGSAQSALIPLIPWLAPLWLAGISLFYLRQAAGWISASRLRRRGVCCVPEDWQRRFAQLAGALRVSKPVALLESCLADTPMVAGHFHPIVLLPVGMLTGLPVAQVEAILPHELAHIRRCDYLVNVWQRFAEGLFFYHPAVWWISRVIRTERENCCDDVVVDWSGDPHEYAVALAALEQNRCAGREPAVAATGGNLVKRIHRLFYPKAPSGNWTSILAAVILVASGAAALTAWQPEAMQPQNRPELNFSKWLNQDVVYIISDQERAAFEKLATDPERNMFIQQFWLRRDPTPGTPENEFKEEHYRRIAFANSHYATASGRLGWQTDRGHIYIVYGPADEMETHAGGTPTSYPYQTWLYKHVEGVGDGLFVTFVDQTRTGDYRLAPAKSR